MVVIQFYNVNLSSLSGLSGESIKSSVKSSKVLLQESFLLMKEYKQKLVEVV